MRNETLLRLARDGIVENLKKSCHEVSFSDDLNEFLSHLKAVEGQIAAFHEIEAEIERENKSNAKP